MAFTDEQNEQIRNDLIREAQRCGITIGMRKTSVEQLTEAVGSQEVLRRTQIREQSGKGRPEGAADHSDGG